jgi:hypothetical protein
VDKISEEQHPSGGERLQSGAMDAVRLAHMGLERFPELVKRHKFIAGGAAVSGSLVVLAGVAIARRLHSGQTEEEAIAALTEEELSGQRIELSDDELYGDESQDGQDSQQSHDDELLKFRDRRA